MATCLVPTEKRMRFFDKFFLDILRSSSKLFVAKRLGKKCEFRVEKSKNLTSLWASLAFKKLIKGWEKHEILKLDTEILNFDKKKEMYLNRYGIYILSREE